MQNSFPFPPASGPGIPFVAVYKTQRDAESETQDRESECLHFLDRVAFHDLVPQQRCRPWMSVALQNHHLCCGTESSNHITADNDVLIKLCLSQQPHQHIVI